MAVLPFVLTGVLVSGHRLSRRLRNPATRPLLPGQLLILSFTAILSHPILDTLNTYGVRWLMPFSRKWFYGDTLFIIDPWVWLALVLGVYYSRRRQTWGRPQPTAPARVAVAGVALYASAMAISGRSARAIVARDVSALSAKPVHTAMTGPVPLDPTVRRFVVEQDGEYRVGIFRWTRRPHVNREELSAFPRGRPSHPAFLVAANTQPARQFLGWARFPTFEIEQVAPGRYLVHMVDLRYARSPEDSFGALTVPVTLGSGSEPR